MSKLQRIPIFLPDTGNPRFTRHVAEFCQRCGKPFQLRSPRAKYCDDCKPLVEREKALQRWKDAGRPQTSAKNWKWINGRKVYVHSGYHQSGTLNNNYKNGTGIDWFAEALKILPARCNRCGRVETDEKYVIRNLLLHHRDGNHNNNDPSNWEILCKKCHQAHHSVRGAGGRFVSNKG